MSSGQYGTKAFFEITFRFAKRTWVHSICSSFELLADKSRDLSQAKKKTAVKTEQIDHYFLSKVSKIVIGGCRL